MTIVDTTIQHQEFSKRESLLNSEINNIYINDKISINDSNSSILSTDSILYFDSINLSNIIEKFKYSIENRTCDINILNNLEFAINNGINKDEYHLLNNEFNKVFMVYNWPSKWYSRVLSNAIFLSAYFRDSNLAILCSNCFKTYTLLDNFHIYSDVVFNSISNSLDIAGSVWDSMVYKSIIDFSFSFIHTGNDVLWETISSIIYRVAPFASNSLPILTDDLGLSYCINGLIVSRYTIAIFSYIKGVLDHEIKSITSDSEDRVLDVVRQRVIEILNRIIPTLPIANTFIEDLCKMSESPENIIAIYIIRKFIKSSKLTINQLMIIGLWSINCSKAIYSKFPNHLTLGNMKSDCGSEMISLSDKLREIIGNRLSECDKGILNMIQYLHLTNYQSHVWACLILMNENPIFDLFAPHLSFSYSFKYSNKYFTNPVPSAVLYSFVCDLSTVIMDRFKSLILSDEQIDILSGIQNLILSDPTLIDSSLLECLKGLFSSNDYKLKLKLLQTLLCIGYNKAGDMIEALSLELLSNKNSSVRLSALKTFNKLMKDYNYNLKLDIIKQISNLYVKDTSKGVCHMSLQILRDFLFFKLIKLHDNYNIIDILDIFLCHLQGRKSLVNYYNALDFTINPIYAMNKISELPDRSIDFWYNYLMGNINTCIIKVLYVMHMFSDVFKSFFLGKLHELTSLFRSLPMDDQIYHLLVELICKNTNGCIDDDLRGELVHFVNYDLKDNSNTAIQSKMRLCISCGVDITSMVISGLDAIKALIGLKRDNKSQSIDQNTRVVIWKLGSILEHLPRIAVITSNDPFKIISDLLDIGLYYDDDNLTIIILSSIYSCISHFENIKYFDLDKTGELFRRSLVVKKLALAVLVTIRRFFSLKFNSTFNEDAQKLGNVFIMLINNNLDLLLYKSGDEVRRLSLIILQGLISVKNVWVKSLTCHLFACYILYPSTRDLCYNVLIEDTGFLINFIEDGMEIIAFNVEDIGKEGQNVMKLAKSFKRLYKNSKIEARDFVKLVINKLKGFSEVNFKPRLGCREKLIFIDLLISFTMVICGGPSLETSLFSKEIKRMILTGDDEAHGTLEHYIYKRLQNLSSYLTMAGKNNIENMKKHNNCNESTRIRLFKKCVKMSVKLHKR